MNIIVHQCSSNAPRLILPCSDATRDINLSYHGDCHYNSVEHVTNHRECLDMSSIVRSVSEIAEKPSPALLKAVSRALPWASSTEQIILALKRSRNDVDAAVELLMLNPDGIEERENDDNDVNGGDTNVTEATHGCTDSHQTGDIPIDKPSPAILNDIEGNEEVDQCHQDSTIRSGSSNELIEVQTESCTDKAARRKERVLKKISVVSKKQSRKVSE